MSWGLQLQQVEIKLSDGREYCIHRTGPTSLTFSVTCYRSRNKTLQQLPWHQRCFFNRSFSLLRLHSSLTRPSVPSSQGASPRIADQSLSQPPSWPRNPLRRRAPSSRTCWRWLAPTPAEALEFKLTSRPVAPWVSIVPLSSPLLLLRTPSEYRFVILFYHHVYWLTQLSFVCLLINATNFIVSRKNTPHFARIVCDSGRKFSRCSSQKRFV